MEDGRPNFSGQWNIVWLVVSNMIFIFHSIWDNPSHWLIFFRGVKTTNQLWFDPDEGVFMTRCQCCIMLAFSSGIVFWRRETGRWDRFSRTPIWQRPLGATSWHRLPDCHCQMHTVFFPPPQRKQLWPKFLRRIYQHKRWYHYTNPHTDAEIILRVVRIHPMKGK